MSRSPYPGANSGTGFYPQQSFSGGQPPSLGFESLNSPMPPNSGYQPSYSGSPYHTPAPQQHTQSFAPVPQPGGMAGYQAAPAYPYQPQQYQYASPPQQTYPHPQYAPSQYYPSPRPTPPPQQGNFPPQGPSMSAYSPQQPSMLQGPGSMYRGGIHAATSQMMAPSQNQGTVIPAINFSPNRDAEGLKKAMKGFGCDSRAVMNILCQRSNAQRQEIKQTFKAMYGKDLGKELISELKGDFQNIIVSLLYPSAELDAWELRKAMKGVGTDEETLIEIMCSRTNAEIRQIKTVYHNIFHRQLEQDLVSETSGHFKRLLVSMCSAGRSETPAIDQMKARQDAQALYKAGEAKLGTDESVFNAIIAAQSYGQLRMVFQEYQKSTGHSIEKAIQREFSGDIRNGLLAIVKCVQNRPVFFAERLYKSMKGLGTNDRQLIRVIVSRCEIDMVQIKESFLAQYTKTLESWIIGDTSGTYKEALLLLIRGFNRNPSQMSY